MHTRALLFLGFVLPVIAACSGGDDDDDGASAPAAPSGLSAALMANKPHLTWTDNADNEEEFMIERMVTGTGAFAMVAMETFDIEQYHDLGAAAGTSYTYRVLAINETGDAPSNEVQITTP